MGEPEVDKKLEGRLFDLLEKRAKMRLGDLVQLRRLSRSRKITLLRAAVDAGRLAPEVADVIAREAGLLSPTASPPSDRTDEFDALPRIGGPEESVDESMQDSEPDVFELDSVDISMSGEPETDIAGFAGFDEAAAPPRVTAPPPLPVLNAPPPMPAVVGRTLKVPEPPDRAPLPMPAVIGAPARPQVVGMPARPAVRLEGVRPADPSAPPPPAPPPFQEARTALVEPVADTMAELPERDTPWRDTEPPGGASLDDSLDESLPGAPQTRYALGRELGRGGMGHVIEARDLALERPVALKLLNEQDDASLRVRFVDEARVTGQLQHPSVPPVYELGRLGDGRLFFAMKRIEGRTLRDLLEDLRAEEPEVVRAFGRVRLLTIFSQICRAIAYAHSRGIIHRDLKPENIMLGGFGEVTVMDWGLAKAVEGGPDAAAPIATARAAQGRFHTLDGEVTGTPQYMPPEQAAGKIEDLGPHSDVYSLGALLYELLTLEPPFDGPTARAIRDAVVNARLTPPSERTRREVPHELEVLCLHCLRKEPEMRPRSAAWIADEVDAFLEGEQDRARQVAERERCVTRGKEAAAAYFEQLDRHRQLQNKSAVTRARMEAWAPLDERRRLWAQEDEEEAARLDAARSLSEALAAYHAALAIDGDHAPTRQALRELYYNAFEAAERDGDRVTMAHYENLVRAFDDDRTFSPRLEGDGRLEIETKPAGLQATLFAIEPVDRVLTPKDPKPVGRTPLTLDPLPMGSYVVRLQAPGLSDTPVPVYVSRQESVRLRLRLFPDTLIGQGFVHIAGGAARLGGDPLAQLARPAQVVEVSDLFLARRPVTAAQYQEFLHALLDSEGPEGARARAPRHSPNGAPAWPQAADGQFIIPDRDETGMAWHPNWAVVQVSCEDAEAYCAWLTERTGQRHRLPTELEWEKAARGADGRAFPWGDTWEPSFCHMGISRPGPLSRGPIGAFATDVSPYGIADMAGGVSEWTASWLDQRAGQRVVKGGHWASGPTECRAASRFAQPVEQVLPTLGFRVARDAPR